jgi:hypothetical protein
MPAKLVIIPVARTRPATGPLRALRCAQVLVVLVSIAGWLSVAAIHDVAVAAARRLR